MSDPRNVAHAKKVTQEKKHQPGAESTEDAPAVQPGRKPAAEKKKRDPAGVAAAAGDVTPVESAEPDESPASKPPAANLEGSLSVLAKLKEMEFHSRATLEKLAEMVLTVGDELKQTELAGPLDEVYSAQNALQTRLTALLGVYQAECDRLQAAGT